MGLPGNPAVPHGQDHLDEPGNARGRFGMTDVAFYRTNSQGPVRVPIGTVHPARSHHFQGISQYGAGAVGLQITDLVGRKIGPLECGAQQSFLGRDIGYGQTTGGAVIVNDACANDAKDLIPVLPGVRQPLEYHHAASFPPGKAVGSRVKGLAASVWAQGLGP